MFIDELTSLLNRYSQENGSDTPDFILAEYLLACLATWNTHVVRRDTWYGHNQRTLVEPPSTTLGSTGDLPSSPVPLTAADTGFTEPGSVR